MSHNQLIYKNKTTKQTEQLVHRAIKPLKETKNGGKRFWEESADFSRNFRPGDTVNCYYDFEKKVFIVEKTDILGSHTISSRKNGKAILDVKNKKLSELFDNTEKVEILYYPNKLIVKVANVEVAKNKRKTKTSWKTYEIFAGGGTLTHMFKKAGFTPIGGLELEDKYLVHYENNHSNESTYTISANIQDVMPDAYTTEADIGLVGIPCTAYSIGNKKMMEAIARRDKGIATSEDEKLLEKLYDSQTLTFYVIEAIRKMNLRTVVIEEVVAYSKTPESFMLRTVLKQMGYHLSETIAQGENTNRQRWCLVADMNKEINLDNLVPKSNKTIEDFLDVPVSNRDWKTASEHPRLKRASQSNGVGIRSVLPSDTTVNTFTTHWTRATEPILKHPEKDLYSEFTNEEIKRIHGLDDYKLPELKTHARQVVGQGVTNMFYHVANRIKTTYKQQRIA